MTAKKIADESRPYLTFFIEYSDKNRKHKFFVLKNFGTTSAKINKITFDKELDKLTERFKFSSLVGGTIAPGQKFTSFISPDYKETVVVSISYTDLDNKSYNESFKVKTSIASSLLYVDENTIEKSISDSADKIVKATKISTNKIVDALEE
ncbi:hypothetical protein P7H60_06440 [Vagococcus carniphilus]|uniref:hypothetical protein n=1 Tax=Vagococcus carniphilus TaxID=218144 RepID=UPI002890CFCA|nr:hypothetical protein [Vagococcus carniphilus]MDT2848795.1 hypothetical protein [Vagococcus carniphilus]